MGTMECMGYEVRTPKACEMCSIPTTHRVRPGGKIRCIDCSVIVAGQAARDMANHEGDHYNNWTQGMKRFMEQVLSIQVDDKGRPL